MPTIINTDLFLEAGERIVYVAVPLSKETNPKTEMTHCL